MNIRIFGTKKSADTKATRCQKRKAGHGWLLYGGVEELGIAWKYAVLVVDYTRKERIYEVVKQIPYGHVATYADVAELAGDRKRSLHSWRAKISRM